MERVNEEVYYAIGPRVSVGAEELEFLKAAAAQTARRRARLCTHASAQDLLHEMFIVHARDAYVRPHAHIGKAESFWLIEGACDVVFFDEDGAIAGYERLRSGGQTGILYYRIGERAYHTLLIRSEWLVFHEVTTGPFDRAKTMLAQWAPDESDPVAVREYLERLEARLRTVTPNLGEVR